MKTQAKTKNKPKNNTGKKTSKKGQDKKKNIKKRRKIYAIIALIVVFVTLLTITLFSDLFNIKKITVINNSKVTTEEIIKNSGLITDNNMFKTLKTTIKQGIKTNPYINNVKITRRLKGEVILDIEERIPTYMLQNENEYIYINNQGFVLEKSQTPLNLPIIKGYKTTDLILGQRIVVEDLEKLDTVIEILDSAKSNGIKDIISAIDISDKSNFILEIPTENKTVQFGDDTEINIKILWIVDLITREKGISGEIIVNVPDIKKVYFREKV